jgi:hypothetical protein
MSTYKPLREEWPILLLDIEGEPKEVSNCGTSAPRSATMAGPLRAARDIDVVVAGNLLVHRNVATCHKEGAVALVEHIGIGVAAVIYVPIWGAE